MEFGTSFLRKCQGWLRNMKCCRNLEIAVHQDGNGPVLLRSKGKQTCREKTTQL